MKPIKKLALVSATAAALLAAPTLAVVSAVCLWPGIVNGVFDDPSRVWDRRELVNVLPEQLGIEFRTKTEDPLVVTLNLGLLDRTGRQLSEQRSEARTLVAGAHFAPGRMYPQTDVFSRSRNLYGELFDVLSSSWLVVGHTTIKPGDGIRWPREATHALTNQVSDAEPRPERPAESHMLVLFLKAAK